MFRLDILILPGVIPEPVRTAALVGSKAGVGGTTEKGETTVTMAVT